MDKLKAGKPTGDKTDDVPGIPTIVFNMHHSNQGPKVSTMKQNSHLDAIEEENGGDRLDDVVFRKLRVLVKQRINTLRSRNQISPFFVLPRLVEADFYAGESWHQYEEKNLSCHKAIMRLPDQPTTHYSDIFEPANGQEPRYVSVLGHPGCGCTTVSLKFADELLSKRKRRSVVLVYNFTWMQQVMSERMTLQELLINRAYPGMTDAECDVVFNWIKENQRHCMLIIDHFNVNRLNMDDTPQEANYQTKATIGSLFALLLSGALLRDVKILTASRPNSVLMLSGRHRPDVTYLMYGFSAESVNTLWTNLVGRNSHQLWEELRRKSSLVLTIMPGSPFLMHSAALAIEAGCGTTAQVYCYMYKHYLRSNHCDLKPVMIDRLRLLAFDHKSVPLSALSMSIDDIKDFMVALPVRRERKSGERLTERDIKLFFIHIIVKEYLACEYILSSLSCAELADYLATEVSKRKHLELLLCSILLDEQVQVEFPIEDGKREIFCDHVINVCKSSTGPVYGTGGVPSQLMPAKRGRYLGILQVAREGNCPQLTRSIAAVFPDYADFTDHKFTESEIHSLCRVLARCENFIQLLVLVRCRLTSQAIDYLTQALVRMPGWVVTVNLSGNRLATREIAMLCRCIGKIERSLILKSCLYDKKDELRPFSEDERLLLKTAISETNSEANIIGD